MTKEEKIKMIDELTEKFSSHNHFYITNASGLTVEQVNSFRRQCFQAGIEYKVYKNTFIRKALEKQTTNFEELFGSLKGFSGILFSKEVANAPAKVVREFRKKVQNTPALKAAYVDMSFYIGDEHLNPLSELKSQKELVGDIISMLQAPTRNVLSALLNRESNETSEAAA